jgi:integrase
VSSITKTTSLTQFLKPTGQRYLFRHRITQQYYGVKTTAGKKVRYPLETADRKEAERKLLAWLNAFAHSTPKGDTANLTMGQLLTLFLKARSNRAKSTTVTEKILAKKFHDWFDSTGKGMGLPVAKVRHSHLMFWLNAIAAGADGKPLRNSSYNRHRLFLMQLCRFAAIELKIANPFDPALIPSKEEQLVRRLVPTEAEFAAIIAEIRTPTLKEPNMKKHGGQRRTENHDAADFAEYLGLAGVGQAEAATLEWSDVSWEQEGTVRYTRHKTGRVFSHPIYPWLRPLLERLRADNKAGKGRIFKIKDVRHSLTAATRRLKLPGFTQRSLRAFLIGKLWKSAVNVKLIAKWQGHSDGGVLIMKVYTEVFGSNDRAYEQAELAKVKWSDVSPVTDDTHPSSP